jgi:class 3 adenylate cyclase
VCSSDLQLLALLNTIFSGFDELAAKYGLEKIRTVGDVYVVAGGLGGNKVDYTSDITNLAYDMREFVATHPDVAKFKLALHIGIASGPVIAGVVGKERFNYDMWGTTVNLAYQLTGYDTKESYIRIDQTTHNRVRLFYTFGAPQMQAFRGQKEETSVYELTGKVG